MSKEKVRVSDVLDLFTDLDVSIFPSFLVLYMLGLMFVLIIRQILLPFPFLQEFNKNILDGAIFAASKTADISIVTLMIPIGKAMVKIMITLLDFIEDCFSIVKEWRNEVE